MSLLASSSSSPPPPLAVCAAASTAAAREFARHVEVDEGILATSAPLEAKALDRILLLVAEGLERAAFPDLEQRTLEIRERLMTQRVIGAAEAVGGMLELLEQHAEALTFFQTSTVQVLTGQRLPLSAPEFVPRTTTHDGDVSASVEGPASDVAREPSSGVVVSAVPKPPPAATVPRPKTQLTVLDALRGKLADTPNKVPKDEHVSPATSSTETSPTKVEFVATSATSTPVGPAKALSRKRSLDVTPPPSSAEDDAKKPKKHAKRKMGAFAEPKHEKKDRNDRSLHPVSTVPAPWDSLHYRPVEVININAPGARDKIHALRFNGTPFILEGYSGWMQFAADWVLPNGSLDAEAFLRGIHDVKVPVLERNYEDTNPIKTHLPLGYYVRNYWEKGKADYYMHQWQFPLSPKAAKLLCYKCEELPVLGDNLLLYWLDAVRGDNPLQYLFMGQRSTTSRMHQDPGGLDITIAPIVGTKRVTMLHRSAAKLDSVHDQVNFHEVDLDKTPLLAFLPAWRVDIRPGQMLYMPEGTFHACENITACLSYHRFHVDTINIPGFLASFMAQDSPSINHAEILWNAVHDVMASLEENFHANGQAIDDNVYTLRKLDSLRSLRHAARILSLEEAVPTEDSWDWKKLLDDIDHLLVRIDPKARKGTTTTTSTSVSSRGGATYAGPGALALPKDESAAIKGKHELHPTVIAAVPVSSGGAKSAATHWDELNLKVGDTIGVQVFEKRNKAQVRKIALNMELVQVHYVDWGSIYDEFLPVSSLYQRSTRNSKRVVYKKAPKVHEPVLAKWGSNGQLYNAIVLKVIRSNACLVHYLKYENDWDQWILPGHIFRKYSSKDA